MRLPWAWLREGHVAALDENGHVEILEVIGVLACCASGDAGAMGEMVAEARPGVDFDQQIGQVELRQPTGDGLIERFYAGWTLLGIEGRDDETALLQAHAPNHAGTGTVAASPVEQSI